MSDIGTIEVIQLPPIETSQHSAADQVVDRQLFKWSPPVDLIPKLPNGYSVSLESWRFRDGVRRFSPANPREAAFNGYTFYDATAFALEASVGGRALLWHRGDDVSSPSLSYELARLFMQYAQHLREHLGETRKLGNALDLCVAARQTRGEQDVLPADIGLDDRGSGERWTVRRLKDEGRHAAIERGIESPTEDDIVRLGLLAAAEVCPLSISDSEAELITRSVLFRIDTDLPPPSDELLAFVAAQIQKSVDKKLDVSNEEFQKWIEDKHSSLIRSIQRASRDALDRNQIKAALLELAWHSVKLFGDAVDEMMRTFRQAMPEPLSVAENFLFEQFYLANPMFGGLPLILLHDRMPFLAEVIPDYWLGPANRRNIDKVRTMLHYYGIIVGNLRDGEARYQRRRDPRGNLNGSVREQRLVEESLELPNAARLDILHDAVRKCAIVRGVIPRHGADEWLIEIVSFDDVNVNAEVYDREGNYAFAMEISRSEFDALVRDASEE